MRIRTKIVWPLEKTTYDGMLMCDVDLQMRRRRVECIKLGQVKRAQERPKKKWMKVIRQDIEANGLNEASEWIKLIHVPDPA